MVDATSAGERVEPEGDPFHGLDAPSDKEGPLPPLLDEDPDEAERQALSILESKGDRPPVTTAYRTPSPVGVGYLEPTPHAPNAGFERVGEPRQPTSSAPHAAAPFLEGSGPWDMGGRSSFPPAEQSWSPAAAPPERGASRAVMTLEDLYARQPLFGTEEGFTRGFRLYIERTRPPNAAGFVEVLHEPISTESFSERYGGFMYKVLLQGSIESNGPDGKANVRTLATLENLRIAGEPRRIQQGNSEMSVPGQGGRFVAGYMPGGASVQGYGGDSEKVAIRRLELDHDRERWAREHQPADAAPHIRDIAEKSIERLEHSSDQRVDLLQQQNGRLIEEMSRRVDEWKADKAAFEARCRDLEHDLFAEKQARLEATRATETDAIRSLKERQQEELARGAAESLTRFNEMSREHRERMDDVVRRNNDERSRTATDGSLERERLRADADKREKDAREHGEQRVQDVLRQGERELSSLRETHRMQLDTMRDAHAREIKSIEISAKSETTMADRTKDMEVSQAKSQVSLAQGETERLRREVDELKLRVNKDPVTYLNEVKQTATTLLHMVDPSEMELDKTPTGVTWQERVAMGFQNAFQSIVEKGPQIAEGFAKVREGNAAAHAAQVQASANAAAFQQGYGSYPGMGYVPMQGLPQGQAQPTSYPEQGLPRGQAPGAPPQRAPRAQRPPTRRAEPAVQVAPPPGEQRFNPFATPPPPAWASQAADPGSPPPGVPAPVAAPPPRRPAVRPAAPVHPAQPLPPPAAEPANGSPVDPSGTPPAGQLSQGQQGMVVFLEQLEQHAIGGTPALLFARGTLDRIGHERVRNVLANVDLETFFGYIPPESYLSTDAGKAYVREVWAKLSELADEPKAE